MWRKPSAELRRVAFTAYMTPSNIDPWRASRAEGDKFTGEQLRALERLRLDAETVDIVEVRSSVSMREYWWPTTESAPVLILECPIIGQVRDRLKVISPAGMTKLVYPNGSITRRRAGDR